jgi:hypothetical protein
LKIFLDSYPGKSKMDLRYTESKPKHKGVKMKTRHNLNAALTTLLRGIYLVCIMVGLMLAYSALLTYFGIWGL